MIRVYPFEELGHADHGWVNARYHFSFASYHNLDRMGFGALRVWNDDTIQAGTGFDMHPHRDMEIITVLRKGAISHKDNKGNSGRTLAGNVQVMSAGSGIYHSEYNHEDEDTQLYQIWIEPKEKGLAPRWDSYDLSKHVNDVPLSPIVSGDGGAPLFINQDADIYLGSLAPGEDYVQSIRHQVYAVVSSGDLLVGGHKVKAGDGVEITAQTEVLLSTSSHAELVWVDVPALV